MNSIGVVLILLSVSLCYDRTSAMSAIQDAFMSLHSVSSPHSYVTMSGGTSIVIGYCIISRMWHI